MKSALAEQNIRIVEGNQGLTLVTVVNASRTKADIERDMKAAELTGTEAANVILLRIIPTKDQNKKVDRIAQENFQLDLSFLASQKGNTLHDCDHNNRQYK